MNQQQTNQKQTNQNRTNRSGRHVALTLAAAAALGFGLAGRAMADGVTTGFALPYGPVGDDSPQENPVTYTSSVVQNNQATNNGALHNGITYGSGDPYVVGTMGYHYATSSFSGGSISTAFDTNGSGINYYGQDDPGSTANYINNTAINNYTTPPSPLNFHSANVAGENAAGMVIGYQSRDASDNTTISTGGTLGRNAYLYDIPANTYANVGLSGTDYHVNVSYNTASGTNSAPYYSSTSFGIDQTGNVVGTTNRYFTGDGTISTSGAAGMGTSVFYYNGSTNSEIGLFGPGYSYIKNFTSSGGGTGRYSSNSTDGVDNGWAAGKATTYVDLGTGSGTSYGADAWSYNPSTGVSTAIGLYQSGNAVSGLPAYSYSYPTTINGNNYDNRSSSISALNAAGQVGGTSSYYNGASSLGTDAWVYTPTSGGSYAQVGLTTGNFISSSGARSSSVTYLNDSGAATGTSVNYNGGTSTYATIPWVTPAGGSPIALGLTDAAHTIPTTGSFITGSVVTELTNSGLVGGYSQLYNGGTTSVGQDAWIYNIATDSYTVLVPNPSSLAGYTGFFSDSISYLAENGDAVGTYQLASGMSYAFLWTPADGFDDLNTDPRLAASLGNSPFTVLTNAYSIDPTGRTIYAFAGTLNPLSGSETQTGVAIITVPEPASISLIGVGALAMLRRRRRTGSRC